MLPTVPFRSRVTTAALLTLVMMALLRVAAAPAGAQAPGADPFAGNWVEDQSKRTNGGLRALTFRRAADGGTEELRGSYANPLVQPVRFGAAPYAVEGSQNRLEWKELGPRRFERLSTRDSKMIGRRRIEVSEDGKTLTEANDTFDAVGAAVTGTLVYRRTSAEANGLIGVWTPESRSATTPFTVTVEAAGKTLRVIENQGLTAAVSYVLSFDGSPAAVTGPSVISGSTVSSQRVSDREIQQSTARLGVPTGVTTWTVSADGKILTTRSTLSGPNASTEPFIIVYQRR